MTQLSNKKIRDKLNKTQSILLESVILALTLLFVTSFQKFITKHMSDWNLFGIDIDVFTMLAVAGIILFLAFIGATEKVDKKSHAKRS